MTKLRPIKSKELAQDVGVALLDLIEKARDAFPSCLSCVYYHEDMNFCDGFKANPPPKIIVHGCENYVDKEAIPF